MTGGQMKYIEAKRPALRMIARSGNSVVDYLSIKIVFKNSNAFQVQKYVFSTLIKGIGK